MENLPAEIKCPNCKAELKLEQKERVSKKFVCPKCDNLIDFSTNVPETVKPFFQKKKIQNLFAIGIALIIAYLGYSQYENYLAKLFYDEVRAPAMKALAEGFKKAVDSQEPTGTMKNESARVLTQTQLSAKQWREKNSLKLALSEFYLLPIFLFFSTFFLTKYLLNKKERNSFVAKKQ